MRENAKVLVVDDDLMMAKTICDILKIKGYDAIKAHSGEEAVEKVKSDEPDCTFIIMDVKMPGMNGIEALKIIKEMAPDLPVVLMSAYATEEQIFEAKEHGAYAVLNKPIDIQELLTVLSMFGGKAPSCNK